MNSLMKQRAGNLRSGGAAPHADHKWLFRNYVAIKNTYTNLSIHTRTYIYMHILSLYVYVTYVYQAYHIDLSIRIYIYIYMLALTIAQRFLVYCSVI